MASDGLYDVAGAINQRLAGQQMPSVGALPSNYYSGSALRLGDTTLGSGTSRANAIADTSSQHASMLSTIQNTRATLDQQTADAKQAKSVQDAIDAELTRVGGQSWKVAWKPLGTTGAPDLSGLMAQLKGLQSIPGNSGVNDSGGSGGSTGGNGSLGKVSLTGFDSQSKRALNTAHSASRYSYLGAANYSKSYSYNSAISEQRNRALALASSYLGTPYVLGGESHTSMDCSGLVQLVYSRMGFRVPTHSAADQGQTGYGSDNRAGNGRGIKNSNGVPGQRTSLSNLVPGDLVAWKDGSHIAIYAGNDTIIESANETVGTVHRRLWDHSGVVGIKLTFPGEGSSGRRTPTVQQKTSKGTQGAPNRNRAI